MTTRDFLVWRAACALIVLASHAMGGCEVALDRTITVNAQLEDHLGGPINGMVVSLVGGGVASQNETNALGQVSLTLTVPDTTESLAVGLWAPQFSGLPADYQARVDRYREVMQAHSFQTRYQVDLIPNDDDYDMTIVGHESVRVSGSLVNSSGAAFNTSVCRLGAPPWMVMSDESTGAFELGGVAKDAAALILIDGRNGQQLIIELTDLDTAADVDLGQITIPDAVTDGVMDLTVSDWDQLDLSERHPVGFVTLVSEDGQLVYSYWLNSAGKAVLQPNGSELPSLPLGKYYLSPDAALGSVVSAGLIELVRDGLVDLDAAGVPSLEILQGQTTTANLSVVASEQAILDAMP